MHTKIISDFRAAKSLHADVDSSLESIAYNPAQCGTTILYTEEGTKFTNINLAPCDNAKLLEQGTVSYTIDDGIPTRDKVWGLMDYALMESFSADPKERFKFIYILSLHIKFDDTLKEMLRAATRLLKKAYKGISGFCINVKCRAFDDLERFSYITRSITYVDTKPVYSEYRFHDGNIEKLLTTGGYISSQGAWHAAYTDDIRDYGGVVPSVPTKRNNPVNAMLKSCLEFNKLFEYKDINPGSNYFDMLKMPTNIDTLNSLLSAGRYYTVSNRANRIIGSYAATRDGEGVHLGFCNPTSTALTNAKDCQFLLLHAVNDFKIKNQSEAVMKYFQNWVDDQLRQGKKPVNGRTYRIKDDLEPYAPDFVPSEKIFVTVSTIYDLYKTSYMRDGVANIVIAADRV